MNSIAIQNMADAGRDVRDEVAEVFVDGYWDELSYFTQDRTTLKAAFKDLFQPEVFYVAEMDGRVAGILACANNRQRAMPVKEGPLVNALGIQTGKLAYNLMKQEFNTDLPYDDETGYIECVATVRESRGKGISTSLMKYVMEKLPYHRYVLEVAEANVNAHRLYAKLGFQEFKRISEHEFENYGIGDRIYMEWCKP